MAKWLGFPVVDSHRGLNLNELPLNHAYVIVNTTVEKASVYSVADNCFECPYKLEKHLTAGEEMSWQVDTSVPVSWRITRTKPYDYIARNNKKGMLCQMRPTFHEYGVYRLDVGRCEVKPEIPPVNTYLPLLICTALLLSGCLVYSLISLVIKRKNKKEIGTKQDQVFQTNVAKGFDENKLSLHVFRGILLSLIIFLTTGGGGYPIFNNIWGGLGLADCVFFAYTWSVGVNIPSVMDKALGRQTKCSIIREIFVRSFLLVVLGSVIDSTVDHRWRSIHPTLWMPLQRLGISYFIVASSYVLTVQKFEMKSKKTICKAIGNVISLLWCWIISGFFLAITAILISTFISFNCMSNVGLEGQKEDYSNDQTEVSQNCNNDFTEYANKIFVGKSKKMVDVTSYYGFSGGLMGLMATIMYTMIGLKAGVVFLHHQGHSDRLKLWLLWASLFGLGGVFFAVVSYPLDFNLWPISSILIISTTALYCFSLVYVVTDIWKISSCILTYPGVTSLTLLCGHLLFSHSQPFRWGIYFRSHILYLLQNFWTVFLWLAIGVGFMKKKIRFEI